MVDGVLIHFALLVYFCQTIKVLVYDPVVMNEKYAASDDARLFQCLFVKSIEVGKCLGVAAVLLRR